MSATTVSAILVYGFCANGDDEGLLATMNKRCPLERFVAIRDTDLPNDWRTRGVEGIEANLAAGAFKDFSISTWISRVRKINFVKYGCSFVQILVMDEDEPDFKFRLIDVYERDQSMDSSWVVPP